MTQPTVVVVGAGVAGLAVAYELMERSKRLTAPLEVLCLEAGNRAGGSIRTETKDGFLCEWAANGFLDNAPTTLTLLRRLGLQDQFVRAEAAAATRYIYRAGKLRRVPTRPLAMLFSDLLPPWQMLRILREPFVGAGRQEDESVFDFARRRIGRGAAETLVDALVSGIFAGDPRQLSLAATFPRMRQMETEHGSLFRAMLVRKKDSAGGPAGPGGRLCSLGGGMQVLTDSLAAALGSRVHLERPVNSVSDMGLRGFRIHPEEGAPLDVDAVVLACPARTAAELTGRMDAEMAEAMVSVPSAPVAVVHLGYREAALGDQPEGFGFLVPRGQGLRILGTLWASSIFRGRAPEGSRLLTSMIGGAHDPGVMNLSDQAMLDLVRGDLARSMNILADPYFVRVMRHPEGIPQYTLGHPARLRTIENRLELHPGLWVCGSSYHGVSINACAEEAPRVAEQTLDFLMRAGRIQLGEDSAQP